MLILSPGSCEKPLWDWSTKVHKMRSHLETWKGRVSVREWVRPCHIWSSMCRLRNVLMLVGGRMSRNAHVKCRFWRYHAAIPLLSDPWTRHRGAVHNVIIKEPKYFVVYRHEYCLMKPLRRKSWSHDGVYRWKDNVKMRYEMLGAKAVPVTLLF